MEVCSSTEFAKALHLYVYLYALQNLNFNDVKISVTTKLCATKETTDQRVTDASLSRLSE